MTLTDDFGNVKEINLLAAADAKTDNTLLYVGVGAAVLAVAAAAVLVLKKRIKA